MSTDTGEYIAFRDSLYNERFLSETHTHHAYYNDGKLTHTCARCHRDLMDDIHVRTRREFGPNTVQITAPNDVQS